MATLEQETILEWLNSHIEKKQLVAAEELCIALLIKSDNVDKCFESYPPSTFLPILLKFFLDEQTSINLLEVAARAITYYLDVSSECIPKIVAIDGAIKAICKRLTLDSVSGLNNDLNEQCIKILFSICTKEEKLMVDAGAFSFIVPFIRDKGQQVHKNTLVSALKILSCLCNKRERTDAAVIECVEVLGALIQHEEIDVIDETFKCFASITEIFTKSNNNSDTVAQDVEKFLNCAWTKRVMKGWTKESFGLQRFLTVLVAMTTNERVTFLQLMAICSSLKPRNLKSLESIIALIKAVDSYKNKPNASTLLSFEEVLRGAVDKNMFKCMNLPTRFRLDQENEIESHLSFPSKLSILHYAAASGQIDRVNCLLQQGLDIDLKNVCGTGFTPLYFAIRNNRQDMVKFLIARGADINQKARFGFTPLNFASQLGYLDIVNTLISNGAGIHIKTVKRNTPLHLAAENGHSDVVNVLIKKGLDVNSANINQTRPLHSAVQNGNIDVIKTLISGGANINAESRVMHRDSKATPLHLGIQTGRVDIVKVLLEAGANVNAKTDLKVTPLHIAAQNGFLELVDVLLKAKANVNSQDFENATPLCLAADRNHIEVVKSLLLVKGIDVNAKNCYKATALHQASQNGYLEVVKLLLDRKAKINSRKDEGFTPLHLAIQFKHVEVSDLLILNGANVNTEDDQNWTPLHNASYNGFSLKIVESLVAKGVNINAKINDGKRALHLAAEHNHFQIINLLLKHKADINALDNRSWTPLHCAAYDGSLEATKCLLENGANVNAKTVKFNTALHFAVDHDHVEVVELLLKEGADINALDNTKWAPLHFAADKGNHQMATVLIKHGALINLIESQDNATPLHLAALHGHSRVVKTLVANGAYVNATMNKNVTALHLGAQNGNVDIVKTLLMGGAYFNAKAHTDRLVLPIHFAEHYAKIFGKLEVYDILELTRMLFKAVYDSCYKEVEKCITNGVIIDSKNSEGKTALHCAAVVGNMEIINILLKNGADASKLTKKCNTSLHLAVSYGHTKVVETLLQSVSRFKICDFINAKTIGKGTTSLHVASEKNFLEIVLTLLKHGATYNIKNKEGKTPRELSRYENVINLFNLIHELFDNIESGNMEIIDELKAIKAEEREAILNARNDAGKSLIQLAIMSKHMNLASSLIEISISPYKSVEDATEHCASASN